MNGTAQAVLYIRNGGFCRSFMKPNPQKSRPIRWSATPHHRPAPRPCRVHHTPLMKFLNKVHRALLRPSTIQPSLDNLTSMYHICTSFDILAPPQVTSRIDPCAPADRIPFPTARPHRSASAQASRTPPEHPVPARRLPALPRRPGKPRPKPDQRRKVR